MRCSSLTRFLFPILIAGCGDNATPVTDGNPAIVDGQSSPTDGSASPTDGNARPLDAVAALDLAAPGDLATCLPSCSTAPLQVDTNAVGRVIHDEIYGLAFADAATLSSLNIPVNRWGGNSTTRYNWQLDTSNTANDYFFENIPNNAADKTYGTSAYVSSADRFVTTSQQGRAATLLTIPTLGFTPKDRVLAHPYTCGFPTEKYGAQQRVDPYDTHCGNGVSPAGAPLVGDPTTTSVAAPPSFEAAWVAHLVSRFGKASAGGVAFYQLDNEMMLWSSTHIDVHPRPVTSDEVWQKTLDYAPGIRAADPSAMILGYGSWGPLDLYSSGFDTAMRSDADRKAHGNVPLAQWYLGQLAAYEQQHGQRLVDCLDVHYYPQGGDPLENTRSLYDPAYHDPSWIDGWLGEPLRLLPRLREWIAAAYPGTGICVSEYNFNLSNANDGKAALVEADVLGIFGREGVRLAAWWTSPTDGKGNLLPPAEAFRMYRNYDGAGAHFGTTSVGAQSALQKVVVHAATQPGTLTIVVINKDTRAVDAPLSIAGWPAAATASQYQYVAYTSTRLGRIADAPVAGGQVMLHLPSLSMTLVVVPAR